MLLTTTLLQNNILLVTWYFILLLLLTTEYYVIASSTFNVNNNNNDGYRFFSILPSRQSPISSSSLQMDAALFPGSEEMEGYCRDDTIITNSNQTNKSRNDTRNQPGNLQYHHTSRIGNSNNIDKKKKKVQKLETAIHQNHENKKREKLWKPMKGKVILDFGIDKGIQTTNKESKFRTLSNLVHGTKSIVKEKLNSLQQHHPPYEKKLYETDTDTTMTTTTTNQIIQQYSYESHHHKDFTAIHQSRTNIKNVDSYVPINNDAKVQISMDPAAASRMLPFLFCVITSFSSAFLGSIRFLGPL